jgi:VanZ family protein
MTEGIKVDRGFYQKAELVSRCIFGPVLLLISYLAFTPIDYSTVSTLWDKLDHALAFFVLAILLDATFRWRKLRLFKFCLLLGYGVFIEVVQWFLSYRDGSILDLLSDAVGLTAYLGVLFASVCIAHFKRDV